MQKQDQKHKEEDNLKIEGSFLDVLKVSVPEPEKMSRVERLKLQAFKNLQDKKNK